MNLGTLALSLPLPPNVPGCIAWAQRAEAIGYESIWIAETGGPDPFVLAGAIAQGASKDPATFEVVCRHQVLVTDDKQGARELFRAALTGYFATPVYNKFAAWYGFEAEAALIAKGFETGDRELTRKGMTDRFVDSLGIFGSLAECRERIAAYVNAGVTTTIVSPLSFDPEAIRRTIEGLAPGA